MEELPSTTIFAPKAFFLQLVPATLVGFTIG